MATADLNAIDQEIKGYKQEVQKIQQQVADAQAQAAAEAAAEIEAQKAEAEKKAQAAEAAKNAAETDYNQKQEAANKAQQDYNNNPTDANKAAADQAKAEADAAKKELDEKNAAANQAKQDVENASKIKSTAGQPYSPGAGEQALLGAIIQSEAGNQGYNGMLAVGSVIMNRVLTRGYGFGKQNTITSVVYAKNQFEPVTRKMVVRENGKYVTLNQTVLQYYVAHPEKVSSDAKAAAAAAINGTRYNPGSGNMNQLFFMTPTALTQQMGRSWMKGKTIADKFVLKGHAFFNVL